MEYFNQLAELAAEHIEASLRETGELPPTALVLTDDSLVRYIPESLDGPESQQDFIVTAQMLVIANKGKAAALAVEAHVMARTQSGDAVPDATENIVILNVEKFGYQEYLIFRVVRDLDGKFLMLAPSPEIRDEMQWCFTGAFPLKPITDRESTLSTLILASKGIKPNGARFAVNETDDFSAETHCAQ